MTGAPKTWFITGTSRGLGRIWTGAALARGDKVAATARDPATLDDLEAADYAFDEKSNAPGRQWARSRRIHSTPGDMTPE